MTNHHCNNQILNANGTTGAMFLSAGEALRYMKLNGYWAMIDSNGFKWPSTTTFEEYQKGWLAFHGVKEAV